MRKNRIFLFLIAYGFAALSLLNAENAENSENIAKTDPPAATNTANPTVPSTEQPKEDVTVKTTKSMASTTVDEEKHRTMLDYDDCSLNECSHGGCRFNGCKESVSCNGGVCEFYNCVKPTCNGGGCTFTKCSHPQCKGGGCHFNKMESTLKDGYCIGGQCMVDGEAWPSMISEKMSE